jgi:hypothetical protein
MRVFVAQWQARSCLRRNGHIVVGRFILLCNQPWNDSALD